jgi:hypothetical protein
MTFKPAIWFPISVVLTLVNLVGVGLAREPWHATIHALLALGFGLWAQRLRPPPGASDLQARFEALERFQDRFEALEAEVSKVRQELSEAQERLDFAERLLAQGSEARRVGAQRRGPE